MIPFKGTFTPTQTINLPAKPEPSLLRSTSSMSLFLIRDTNASKSQSSRESEIKEDTIQRYVHSYTDYRPTGKTILNTIIEINIDPSLYDHFIQSQNDAIEQDRSRKN